jgi:hypothetical protein
MWCVVVELVSVLGVQDSLMSHAAAMRPQNGFFLQKTRCPTNSGSSKTQNCVHLANVLSKEHLAVIL